jgi:4-hydroxybenzoate polyprenyltransferase
MTERILLLCGIMAALLPAAYMLLTQPHRFKILLADSRFSRILHFLLMAFLGTILQVDQSQELLNPELLLRFGLFFCVLFYAGQFAIVTNNLEDLEADKITNTDRPLVKALIPQRAYLRIGIFCLLYSFLLASIAGLPDLLAIAGISLIYFLYSVPPFKLKRFVIFAKFLIGLNSLIAAVYGFLISGGSLFAFPLSWAIFILVPISLSANFVDLKDTEGDRIAGVKTLPVLLGERKATQLIAGFTLLTYVYTVFLLNSLSISVLILLVCCVHLALLLRKPYSEKPLFLLHNSLFIGLIVLILILKESR